MKTMAAGVSPGLSSHLSNYVREPPAPADEAAVSRLLAPTTGFPVLVTLPVYNEAKFLRGSVAKVRAAMDLSGIPYILSIAEDGSTDSTEEVLDQLRAVDPRLIIRSSRTRLGRGRALRDLWSSIDASVYAFLDADLASEPAYLVRAIELVRRGADVAMGSRYVGGAVVQRPPLRSTFSRIYNWLIRFLTGDPVHDHQCGVKAASRRALDVVLPLTNEDSWFWDAEFVVLAYAHGLQLAEFPVVWREAKVKRTNLRRLLSDVYLHGTGLMRLVCKLDGPANEESRPRLPAGHAGPTGGQPDG